MVRRNQAIIGKSSCETLNIRKPENFFDFFVRALNFFARDIVLDFRRPEKPQNKWIAQARGEMRFALFAGGLNGT